MQVIKIKTEVCIFFIIRGSLHEPQMLIVHWMNCEERYKKEIIYTSKIFKSNHFTHLHDLMADNSK